MDAVRYFCVSRTLRAEKPTPAGDVDEDGEEESYDSFMTGGEISEGYLL